MKKIELVPTMELIARFITRRPMPDLREALGELRARKSDHLKLNEPPRKGFFK